MDGKGKEIVEEKNEGEKEGWKKGKGKEEKWRNKREGNGSQ